MNLSRNTGLRTVTIRPNRIYYPDLDAWVMATLSTIPSSVSSILRELHYLRDITPLTHSDTTNLLAAAALISNPSSAFKNAQLKYTFTGAEEIDGALWLLQTYTPKLYSDGRIILLNTET